MKFPYGISDFYKIMTEDYFYVDRTAAISRIEEYGKNLLFLRPRRFGKSLFLSTLQNYYEVNKADEFERLFAHLAIGQNPTENHSQYLVMRWNFSTVDSQEELEHIRRSLYNHINDRIQGFAVDYQEKLSQEIKIDRKNALFSFGSALTAVRQTPYKMYLLIDEYDNFANSVLMSGHLKNRERYEELVKGEGVLKTLKTIFLTTLFNDIAYIMDSELALERTYSDLTMIVRPEIRQYKLLDILMEFKFVKLHQTTADKKSKLSGEQARAMSRAEILALEKVKEKMAEAVVQVTNYRQRLLDKYGEMLSLRSYAVVFLGFERVVWQEVL